MELAPARYMEMGADRMLVAGGMTVSVARVERRETKSNDIEAVVEVNAQLAGEVRNALSAGSYPLVLGGACNVCLGALAGLGSHVGVVWLDAHGDFNTPQTSPSGYFDGMPLAIAAGRCHSDVLKRVGGLPVREERVLLVGVRDLDPGEKASLESSEVVVVEADRVRRTGMESALQPTLDLLTGRVGEVYLHLDLDVLNPADAPGVNFPTPGGLSLGEVEAALAMVRERFHVRGASLTAYDPTRDEGDRTFQTALRLIEVLAASGD